VKWRKLQQVYVASGEHEWAASHAHVPTSIVLDSERIRVYAAFLDRSKVGRPGFVDVDASDPTKVLDVSSQPVLDIGEPGTFDDSGVTPLSVVEDEGKLLMYYAGWQLGTRIRYFLFTGLAISEDGGNTFERYSRVPILDRSDAEPLIRSACHVLRSDDGLWRMWYGAGDRWISDPSGKPVPTYTMRYLESHDGRVWGPQGAPCLDLRDADEFGFGRPCVLQEGGLFKMWYSRRSLRDGYRLGYAESPDGKDWTRLDDQVGIDVSDSGWDSEMQCYPSIQRTPHGTFMFYGGNGYGATGFGVAVAQE
jgi:hypothetical protein